VFQAPSGLRARKASTDQTELACLHTYIHTTRQPRSWNGWVIPPMPSGSVRPDPSLIPLYTIRPSNTDRHTTQLVSRQNLLAGLLLLGGDLCLLEELVADGFMGREALCGGGVFRRVVGQARHVVDGARVVFAALA